jgi:cation transport regulator ChaC
LILRSASLNFAFTNYRPARVSGWQRVFNMSHAGNMRHEGTWHYTGEVASLAFMRSQDVVSDVVLLDVDDEGLAGFLVRESL